MALARRCLRMTNRACDFVLDAGSGTTLLAAQSMDRRWVGVELKEKYVRLTQAPRAMTLAELKDTAPRHRIAQRRPEHIGRDDAAEACDPAFGRLQPHRPEPARLRDVDRFDGGRPGTDRLPHAEGCEHTL